MMIPLSSPLVLHQLDTVGYKETPPIPARAFDGWSLLYLISGEVLSEADGAAFLLRGHEMLLVPPGVPFRVSWYRNSIGYVGGFREEVLRDRSSRILRQESPVKVTFRAEDEGLLDELMQKIFRERRAPEFGACCLEVVLRQAGRELPASLRHPLSNAFLDRLFDWSVPPGGVAFYAGQLGVTPNHLNRSVKAHTGRSAREWIDIARLSLARQLLRDPQIPVIDVAARVGLEDQSYFSRFFRRHEGMTPTQFRNKKS